jgi:hypothetical protein
VKVVIESYLTEAKPATALQQIVGAAWAGGQVLLPGFPPPLRPGVPIRPDDHPG